MRPKVKTWLKGTLAKWPSLIYLLLVPTHPLLVIDFIVFVYSSCVSFCKNKQLDVFLSFCLSYIEVEYICSFVLCFWKSLEVIFQALFTNTETFMYVYKSFPWKTF